MVAFVLSQVLMRSRILRENGKYIPRQVSGRDLHSPQGFWYLVIITAVCVCVCLVVRHEETLLQQRRNWLL